MCSLQLHKIFQLPGSCDKQRAGAFQCRKIEHMHSLHSRCWGHCRGLCPAAASRVSMLRSHLQLFSPHPELPVVHFSCKPAKARASLALYLYIFQGSTAFFPRPGLGTVQLNGKKDFVSQLTGIHQLLGTLLCMSKCYF